MSGISKVSDGVWRWDGVDADHGFPIVGYLVEGPEGLVLIDPPATSGTKEAIGEAGDPKAILLTSAWHVRGAGIWKERLEIPIAAPASAEGELSEANTRADHTLGEGDQYLGWQVFHLHSKDEAYTELVFWDPEKRIAVVGDLLVQGEDGSLTFGPHVYMKVPLEEVRPLLRRVLDLNPALILSSHLGPMEEPGNALASLAG